MMMKRKINNMQDLEQEISRLKKQSKRKEAEMSASVDEIVQSLQPARLLIQGTRSLFSGATKNKSLLSTGISFAAGIFIEKVLLRKSNFLVKYGLSHIAINLITNLVDENWNPQLMQLIREKLSGKTAEEEAADADDITAENMS
jgi:hypothetical protein